MKASFRLGPIELAVSTPPGVLERIILSRYRWFLGAVKSPAVWLMLEPMRSPKGSPVDSPQCRVAGSEVELVHPLFAGQATAGADGSVRVVPTAVAIDGLFETLTAVLAPARGAVVVEGASVISRGRGHLILGRDADAMMRPSALGGRVALSPSRSLLVRDAEGSLAFAAPFRADAAWPARSASLEAIWVLAPEVLEPGPIGGAAVAGAILEHALLPLRDAPTLAMAFDVATELAVGVSAATLAPAVGASWSRLDELAAAFGVRRALSVAQPELRARLLHRALDAPSEPRE